MRKIKTFMCGAVAVIAAATAICGGVSFNRSEKTKAAENQRYSIDFGEYTPKADSSVNIDLSYTHGAYVHTKRATDGNIRLKFKTLSYEADFQAGDLNGLVRGVYSDPAYSYVPFDTNYWLVFGDSVSQALYSVGEYTDVLYDVISHSFTVSVGETVPVMTKFSLSQAGSVADASGANTIAWDSNNMERKITASLTDFSVTDEDGYYLGVSLSREANAKFLFSIEENMYGYAGEIVTFKYFGEGESPMPCVYGEDGKKIRNAVTDLGGGVYSFVMPEGAVKIRASAEADVSEVYGTYYDSATDNIYVLGETSYKSINGNNTDITFKAYTDGTVIISDGGETTEGSFTLGKLAVGETVYKKLLKYKVEFVVLGETVKSETISSGSYRVTAPEDPVKEGYEFVGWKNGKGEAFDGDKTVTSSAIYYAEFTERGGHINPSADPKGESGCKSSAASATVPFASLIALMAIKAKRKGEK